MHPPTWSKAGLLIALSALLIGEVGGGNGARAQAPDGRIVVEDFERYELGVPPYGWKRPHKRSRSLLELPRVLERDDDYFEIVRVDGGKRVRAYTKDETVQVVRLNGDGYRWNLRTHPRLAWEWRAVRLPAGAREDREALNDAGAALYVTFDSMDWLGRPRTIKYTYSSTLPLGTTASYGALRVLVVSSGADGYGAWQRIERDVAADYRRLFDRAPPDEPGFLMLWSDSDNTHDISDVYFDNIELLPGRD